MKLPDLSLEAGFLDWLSPNLGVHWKLAKLRDSNQIILRSLEGNIQHQFSELEGFALQHFTGQLTLGDIQQRCFKKFGNTLSPNLMTDLLQKLVNLEVLELETLPSLSQKANNSPTLKACVHWIEHPDGYWILRNPEDVTFLQINDQDKEIIEQLGKCSKDVIISEFCITPSHLKKLLQLLTVTAMLEGTTLPKPPRRKFTPMRLLSFRIPLFNPDPFLSRYIDLFRWIWTKLFAIFTGIILLYAAVIFVNQRATIFHTGQQFLSVYGSGLIIPFALLSMFVVALHELGHAFTLKHFGGIVPEIGLLLIMFMPAAYTNTTDSYCLPRFKRVLVVAAGLLVQFLIAAFALGLWNISTEGTWLHIISYLLMSSALITVAINLNPLAKFDGYHLAVAFSGINNLRARSFNFYANLFRNKPIQETFQDKLILAFYAPLSLAYIWFVFSFLFLKITEWSLTNIPTTLLFLFTIWTIYFYFPSKENKLN